MPVLGRKTTISQMNLVMSPDLLLTFKAACLKRNTSPTHVILRMIREQMSTWGESTEVIVDEKEKRRG